MPRCICQAGASALTRPHLLCFLKRKIISSKRKFISWQDTAVPAAGDVTAQEEGKNGMVHGAARRGLLGGIAGALLLAPPVLVPFVLAPSARAQLRDFPARPVRFIIPSPP